VELSFKEVTTTHPDTDSAVSLTCSLLHSGQTLLRRHSPGVTATGFYNIIIHESKSKVRLYYSAL